MNFDFISALIRPPDQKRDLIHPDQATHDIINLIMEAFKLPDVQLDTEPFAAHLAGDTIEATCRNIWEALRENVKFIEDKSDQNLQSPSHLWKNGKGDCKSMTLWAGSVLMNLGIKFNVRFVSEKQGEDIHHVYIAVPDGDGEVIIDATLPEFNRELPYAYKKDYPVTGRRIGAAATVEADSGGWLLTGLIALLVIWIYGNMKKS